MGMCVTRGIQSSLLCNFSVRYTFMFLYIVYRDLIGVGEQFVLRHSWIFGDIEDVTKRFPSGLSEFVSRCLQRILMVIVFKM